MTTIVIYVITYVMYYYKKCERDLEKNVNNNDISFHSISLSNIRLCFA